METEKQYKDLTIKEFTKAADVYESGHAGIKEAVDAGRSNPDPVIQAKWAGFEYAGDKPTLEEFILWMTEKIKESGD